MPPWLNDKTRFWSYTDTDLVEIGSRVVFGSSEPPDQYRFVFVPRNAEVLRLVDTPPNPSSNVPDISLLWSLYRVFVSPVSTPILSSSSNLVKGIAALLQLFYTSSTLYHSIGGQVIQYGFVAPGLTVLPYAVMSALNLMASLVAPHYPTLYLVRSEVMEEAERRTGSPFHYVVGKVVDESGTDSDVMEGWSEIAGSFNDDDKVLNATRSAEEDEKIEICGDNPIQRIYVPACPRFRRTDDTQTSPLGHFIETHLHRLVFPRYIMARCQQAIKVQPSLISFSRLSSQLQSCVQALRAHIHYTRLPQRPRRPRPINELNAYEICLVAFINSAEFFIMLALSNFSGQQSTLAQRAWIVTWLFAGSVFAATLDLVTYIQDCASTHHLLYSLTVWAYFIYVLSHGAIAIGGFVVVSQMLSAYGICHKTV